MSPGHLRASTPEITATTPDGSVTYDNKVTSVLRTSWRLPLILVGGHWFSSFSHPCLSFCLCPSGDWYTFSGLASETARPTDEGGEPGDH